MFGCGCELGDNYSGSLEYNKTGRDCWTLDGPACELCSGQKPLKIKYLPESIFIRINNSKKSLGTFNDTKTPKFKGYVMGGVIQFHSEKNHFRVIKMFGRESGLLIDGDRE